MRMIIPQVTFEVVSATGDKPIKGVTAKFMNVELGRRLTEAFEGTTDASGTAEVRLADGIGTYNVLSGPDLDPMGRQVVIDQSKSKLKFQVRGTDAPVLFTGTVKQQDTFIKDAKIMMSPADDAVVGADMRRPIVSDVKGAFSREGVPVGKYRVTVTARDCRAFNGLVELTQKQTTADFVLQPCNKALEQNLVALLTEQNTAAIMRHYNAARQADRNSAGPDYAMALVMLNQQNLAETERYFSAAVGQPSGDEFWDRAADGRLWLYMNRHSAQNVKHAVALINSLGTRFYPQREPTDASLETAYVMGVIVGVLKGPWKEAYADSGIDQSDAAIEKSLQNAHREHYTVGRDEILDEFTNAGPNQPADQNQGQMNANQKRINDRIKEILDELKTIDAQIARENGQRDAIIAQNKAQLDKLQRDLNDLEKNLIPLLAQERALGQKQAQNSAVQRSRGATPALREEERMLQGDLLIIKRKIAALEGQLNKIDAERKPIETQNADAIRRAKQITDQLQQTKQRLLDELRKLQQGGNPNGRQQGDAPPNNEPKLDFNDYLQFDVNDRRNVFLEQLANGCGGQPLPQPITR